MKLLVLFLSLCLALPAVARDEQPPPENGRAVASSGLPLPRFVSTRSDSVNVRSGPGERYPVLWVLRRKGMPVEVTAEYENWRKIRDWEGTEGWVHQALLSGRRVVVVYPAEAVLRIRPDAIARPVARMAAGVTARVESCSADWCQLQLGQASGWISKQQLWGIYPGEMIK
jgi:SH3-like domain-containing protein